MIKFINLETGYTFDGLWTNDQQNGYIFWFPNEQSTDIIHSMQICIIAETKDALHIKMEENDIFWFPNVTNNFELENKEYECVINDWVSIDNKYVQCFNVLCSSKSAGEYICKIEIGDEGYIKIGADFYGEYEPIYINLSNFGVEIPQTVQKAIYCSNIHEEITDHILLNRKFKELLSNYWNTIANKGSYKSLLNSLKWFEYNNDLNIKEIWKRNEGGRLFFSDADILETLENNVSQTFINNIKTTYIALYYALYNEKSEYDTEGNPVLEENVFKWTKDDMQLKMTLLSHFFGTYFMPIHLSILHSTLENKVFTNTIKAVKTGILNRVDSFSEYTAVESNIKDDSIFKLTNVRAGVTNNTVYKSSEKRFGVDVFPSSGIVDDTSIELFDKNYYTGPGVIVPIKFKIRNQVEGDFIKQTIVSYTSDEDTSWTTLNLYDKFEVGDHPINECDVCGGAILDEYDNIKTEKRIDIDFNFLATQAREYVFNFTFITVSSKTINKSIKFKVEDVDNLHINVYKVVAKDDSKGFTYEHFRNIKNYRYFMSITKNENVDVNNDANYYTQYLPCSNDGVKLNRTIIIVKSNKNIFTGDELSNLSSKFNDYLEFRRTNNEGVFAVTFVSKKFANNDSVSLNDNYKILRDEYVFYPQFHDLILINGNKLDNYTINQNQALCCAAEINNGKTVIPFRYGNLIEGAEWTFTNSSNKSVIYHPSSSQKPFIAKSDAPELLEPGYYDIEFRYKLYQNEYVCKLNSAFRVVK